MKTFALIGWFAVFALVTLGAIALIDWQRILTGTVLVLYAWFYRWIDKKWKDIRAVKGLNSIPENEMP